ncbi:MAG: hypothetical protein H0U53_11070 [Actinobacteria bacterium]|nr:hypothetical protein [Actinomycetota bacterium]
MPLDIAPLTEIAPNVYTDGEEVFEFEVDPDIEAYFALVEEFGVAACVELRDELFMTIEEAFGL